MLRLLGRMAAAFVILEAGSSVISLAGIVNPDNLLVSMGPGFGLCIKEYTPVGGLVQTIPVPYPPGPYPTSERPRDLVVMPDGRIALFNGTFDPYLSIYEPVLETWQHATFPGWSTGNNGRFAGIGAYGPYIFVSDGRTSGDGGLDELQGTIRFDTRDMSAVRFESIVGTHAVTVGLDGKVYALGASDDPTRTIKVFDPTTLLNERTITIPFGLSPNDIAVNAAGEIYLSSNGGTIYVLGPTGGILRSVSTGISSVRDLDLAPDGRIVFGTYINGVYITDESLTSFAPVVGGWDHYVAFGSPVPEPATLALLVFGGGLVARRFEGKASQPLG